MGKMEIYNIPKIKNNITESGWRYVQVNANTMQEELKNKFPDKTINSLDIPAYTLLAAHSKNITNQFPDQHSLQNKNNTWTRLDGSPIQQRISINEKRDIQIPGAFFNPDGKLHITRLDPGYQSDNLLNRCQIPVKPRKAA